MTTPRRHFLTAKAKEMHEPLALTDRLYVAQIRALRPVYRDQPMILHRAPKTGSEAKFVQLTKMNEPSGTQSTGGLCHAIHETAGTGDFATIKKEQVT